MAVMGVVCHAGAKALVAIWALAPLAAHGLRFPQPARPTYHAGLPPHMGLSPSPTPGPELPELRGRQDIEACAYIYGATLGAITCDPGYTCSTKTAAGVFRCCSSLGTNPCVMPTACLDYTAYRSGLCSSIGSSTLCCTESANPYCMGIPLVDKASVSLLACLPERSFIPVYASVTDSTSTPTTTINTTSSDPTPPTPFTNSVSPTPNPAPATDSGPPVGAIVGGTVGGVAVIAIAAGFIAWMCIKSRRGQNGQEQGQWQQPPQPQQQVYAGGPQTAQYGGPYHAGHLSFGSWSHTRDPSITGLGVAGSDAGGDKNVNFQPQVSQLSPVSEHNPQQHNAQPQQQQAEIDLPHYRPGAYVSELQGQDPNMQPN